MELPPEDLTAAEDLSLSLNRKQPEIQGIEGGGAPTKVLHPGAFEKHIGPVLCFKNLVYFFLQLEFPSPSGTTDEASVSAIAKVAQVNPTVTCYGCAMAAAMAVN